MSDPIDRAQAMTELQMSAKRLTLAYEAHGEGQVEYSEYVIRVSDARDVLLALPSAQQDVPDTNVGDTISRQAAIDAVIKRDAKCGIDSAEVLKLLPPAQPEQKYTNKELRVFMHGISMRLLSLRSAQHWKYDDETAEEIKFLERLYKKVESEVTQ